VVFIISGPRKTICVGHFPLKSIQFPSKENSLLNSRPITRISCLLSLVVAASLLFTQLAGCEQPSHPELRGHLYFGSGQYLGRLDLRDGSTSVEANLGDVSIRRVSAYGDENLLLTVFGIVNHKETYRLMQYEIATGQTGTLFKGRKGLYLAGQEMLVYDDRLRLRAKVRGEGGRVDVDLAQHEFGDRIQLIPVSDSRFLYSIGDTQGERIFAHDAYTQTTTYLEKLSAVCGLDGAIWIDESRQLLCRMTATSGQFESYSFFDLDGTRRGRLSLPESRSFRAVAYLQDQEALVLTQPWHTLIGKRGKTAIWIYDLGSDEYYRLAKDQYLGETVVYKSE
jgi:hypothetical protein